MPSVGIFLWAAFVLASG